ncbi:unnamed protein product [Parnassius apollo]|uniref:(apollo) hypothetical protein n=1 Tax=Parnassius apollo TaxID=110799 RepID=A0A8S3W3P2_PARAO|nr:unnamed protein product [Parnassius apollo]
MSSEEYSNRVLKQSNWNEVADIIYDDWQNLEENTNQKRIDLHKKWKGLRDYHTREKNKDSSVKSGSGATKKRKTPYLDMLHFLNVSRASNQTYGNISAEKSSDSSAILDENDSTDSVVNVSRPKKMTVFQEALINSMEKREKIQI